MSNDIRIALSIPDEKKKHRHFSLQLQQEISIAPVKLTKPEKVLVVSGFEGNFMALLKALLANKVIDKYLRWTFKDGHLVIPGNCLDKEGKMVECLWLLYALEEKARRAGGFVHFLIGAHEVIHINGSWRYFHPHYAPSSKTIHTALYHGNNELWQWLRTKNFLVQIGDMLFLYAGIGVELLNLNMPITSLNAKMRDNWLSTNDPSSELLLKNILSSSYCYQSTIEDSEELVNAALQRFKINTIVTSHPGIDNINSFFNRKVINIHTNTEAGNSICLLIKKHRCYITKSYRKRQRIK